MSFADDVPEALVRNKASFDLPEMISLLHLLIDDLCDLSVKIVAVQALIDSLVVQGVSEADAYSEVYHGLLLGTTTACSVIASTPSALGGGEDCTRLLETALCGLVPCVISHIELARQEPQGVVEGAKGACRIDTSVVDAAVERLFKEAHETLQRCETASETKAMEHASEKGLGTYEASRAGYESGVGGGGRHGVRTALICSLYHRGLLTLEECQNACTSLCVDPKASDGLESIRDCLISESTQEAKKANLTLDAYFDQYFSAGMSEDQPMLLRLGHDHAAQDALSFALLRALSGWGIASDTESMSKACKGFLDADQSILRSWLMFVAPAAVLSPLGALFDDSDGTSQFGDEPSSIGPILLFAQLIAQAGLSSGQTLQDILPHSLLHLSERNFFFAMVRTASVIKPMKHLTTSEQELTDTWILSLFGSEGISDELIRSSSPPLLLSIIPTIFAQTITATMAGLIEDAETLRGGLTYFLQDFLSFALPGAILSLLSDVERCTQAERSNAKDLQSATERLTAHRRKAVCIDFLCVLLQSDHCPKAVKYLVAERVTMTLDALQATSGESSRLIDQMLVLQSQRYRLFRSKHLWSKITQATVAPCLSNSLIDVRKLCLHSVYQQWGTKAIVDALRKCFSGQPLQPSTCSTGAHRSASFSLTLLALRQWKSSPVALAQVVILQIVVAILEEVPIRAIVNVVRKASDILARLDSSSTLRLCKRLRMFIPPREPTRPSEQIDHLPMYASTLAEVIRRLVALQVHG